MATPPAKPRNTPGTPQGDTTSSRRSFREILDSLSLTAQFRIASVVAVALTLLAVQLVTALWQTWSARQEALTLAEAVIGSAAEQPGGGSQAVDELATQSLFLAAELKMPAGDVVRRFARDDAEASFAARAEGDTWTQRALGALALGPIYLERTVAITPQLDGTLGVLIDAAPLWSDAERRLRETPFVLALGCLLAFLAANSLRRKVVEPLAQLASQTRMSHWQGEGAAPRPARRANELTELAHNFQALADRLAEYEADLRNLRVTSRQQIIDTTKELELRLRTAEALTRSKDEFLANMSHEIRTPMNGVLGMAELLAGTELDRRQRRYVDSMRTAAETMMQVINDILDDSKIEAGRMDLVQDVFDVREMAEEVGQLFAGRAETKNIELICRVEPTVPKTVLGDVLRLRQVLGNLLSNAVKYTEQGEIQIRVGLDDIQESKCRLYFSVADTGPGIPESEQAAVFEAFTQLSNAKRVGGTGLGLSIATRLVKLMGGERIDLRSEVGKGSTFSFVLPFEAKEAAPAPDRTSDECAGMRVMVVDDNPNSYMFLEETLANWSADVTVLHNAQRLGDKLRDAAARGKPYAAVLLDHSLPDADTADLLRTIRLEKAIADTYVVLLSAFDYDPAYEGAQAIKPDVCLAKPVRQRLLKSTLQVARMPRQAEAPASGRKSPKAAGTGGPTAALGLNVLVVDDNVINREVAVAMLERLGCLTSIAEDGIAAVRMACERSYDVILMDCQMPGMDGYAATQAIRKDEAALGRPAVAIVALTANVLARDRLRCEEAGMNHFLGKPFKHEQLLQTLRPIAQGRGTLVEAPAPVQKPVDRGPAAVKSVEDTLTDTVALEMLETPLFEDEAQSRLPVLDLDQVESIRSLGKPQVFERLCDMLFASAPDALRRIDAALSMGDLEGVASAAHAFKSPVSNLGGRRLAEQLERCEEAARDRADIEATREVVKTLAQAYSELDATLRAEVRRTTAA
jgi:signal transduction histidine kinase/CheY-like chemotaxis protein/HPt (histidine-containing phosphotransfer) domain-containing protein